MRKYISALRHRFSAGTEHLMKRSSKSRTIEHFDAAISVPTSSYYGNKLRMARCRICNKVAHYRVTRDMQVVTKMEYYCDSCVSKVDD